MQLLIDLALPPRDPNIPHYDEWDDEEGHYDDEDHDHDEDLFGGGGNQGGASSSEPANTTWMRIVRRRLPGKPASDAPVHWPPWMRVNINDAVTVIGTGGVPARIAGHGEPIDVTRWVHSGTNYLGISNWPDATLTIAFVTTKTRTAKKLAERIVSRPRQSYEEAKQRIANLVKHLKANAVRSLDQRARR